MSAEINNCPSNLQKMRNYFLLLYPTDVVKNGLNYITKNFVFYSSNGVVQIEGMLDLTYTSDVETR
jgi:hypothetical protein